MKTAVAPNELRGKEKNSDGPLVFKLPNWIKKFSVILLIYLDHVGSNHFGQQEQYIIFGTDILWGRMNNFLIACMYQILLIYQLSNNSMFVPDITELEVALSLIVVMIILVAVVHCISGSSGSKCYYCSSIARR